jgi:hypothetical protein
MDSSGPLMALAEFKSLVKRSGLTLAEAHTEELWKGYNLLRGLIDAVHGSRSLETESAHIFPLGRDRDR